MNFIHVWTKWPLSLLLPDRSIKNKHIWNICVALSVTLHNAAMKYDYFAFSFSFLSHYLLSFGDYFIWTPTFSPFFSCNFECTNVFSSIQIPKCITDVAVHRFHSKQPLFAYFGSNQKQLFFFCIFCKFLWKWFVSELIEFLQMFDKWQRKAMNYRNTFYGNEEKQ